MKIMAVFSCSASPLVVGPYRILTEDPHSLDTSEWTSSRIHKEELIEKKRTKIEFISFFHLQPTFILPKLASSKFLLNA